MSLLGGITGDVLGGVSKVASTALGGAQQVQGNDQKEQIAQLLQQLLQGQGQNTQQGFMG